MAEPAQCTIDLRTAHRWIPDLRQNRIIHLVDGGQRMFLREAKAARIDEAAMRQYLIAPYQDEVVATGSTFADQVGKVAHRHGGHQPANECIVDAAHRRADIEHRLLLCLAPE